MKEKLNLMCYKCKKNTLCELKEEIRKEKIDKYNIEFLKKYYICKECGEEVFTKETFDYNIRTANNEIRKQTGMIRVEQIEEILDKYSIGKKPLSLVLGLGEITITRYIEGGGNPSKDNSDLLKAILENPYLYELFLNANKDKITGIAYKKSLGKTKQLELTSSNSKLYNTALYIIDKTEDITQLGLQKVLYFTQVFSNKLLNNKIYNDESEAWIHGPVYREIYDSFSYYKNGVISPQDIIKNREYNLTNEEKEYIDGIIKYFGCYSGKILREMTHLTKPWIDTRKGLKEDEPSNRIISIDSITSFGNEICKKYNIEKIDDLKKYSEYLFNEVMK